MKTGDDIPRVTALRSHDVRAGFSPDVQAALAADPALVAAIAGRILEQHFPESLHQDILNAVGLTLETAATRRKRDPAFRQRVLRAYEFRCAVCGFDVRLGSVSIALDAAHIRWHQAGGPETEDNGLALCVLHHKTFDLGAFTVSEGVLLVSDQANGTAGFQEHLMAYHGKPIRAAAAPRLAARAEAPRMARAGSVQGRGEAPGLIRRDKTGPSRRPGHAGRVTGSGGRGTPAAGTVRVGTGVRTGRHGQGRVTAGPSTRGRRRRPRPVRLRSRPRRRVEASHHGILVHEGVVCA